jgi:hypothetical protein
MGCGCNKGSSKDTTPKTEEQSGKTQQSFRLELPTGQSLTYGSRLEAEAARVRSGGGGTVVRF